MADSTAPPEAPPAKMTSREAALAFIDKLRSVLDTDAYSGFLTLMQEFRDDRIDAEKLVLQVAALFISAGHRELFAGFGAFLPPGMSEDNSAALRVIAFMHGVRLNQK